MRHSTLLGHKVSALGLSGQDPRRDDAFIRAPGEAVEPVSHTYRCIFINTLRSSMFRQRQREIRAASQVPRASLHHRRLSQKAKQLKSYTITRESCPLRVVALVKSVHPSRSRGLVRCLYSRPRPKGLQKVGQKRLSLELKLIRTRNRHHPRQLSAEK